VIRVLSISGGKDSTAAALYLEELGLEVHARTFQNTGWEHPDTYEHLDLLEQRLGPITRLRVDVPILPGYEADVEELETMLGIVPSAMVRLCVWKGCFPGQGTRWCTQNLKTVPAARWLATQDDAVENVVGVRRAESIARSQLPEREPMARVEVSPVVRLPDEGRWIELDHVEQWRPLVDWSEADVVAIHARHGLQMNPLYRRGAGRVGCWPCIFAGNKTDLPLLAQDDQRIAVIRRLEEIVNARAQARHAARVEGGIKQRKDMPPPTWFQIRDPVAMARWRAAHPDAVEGVDENSRHLCVPIDQAIEWGRTSRGGRQVPMFEAPHRDWACSRYGYCETRPSGDETRPSDDENR